MLSYLQPVYNSTVGSWHRFSTNPRETLDAERILQVINTIIRMSHQKRSQKQKFETK